MKKIRVTARAKSPVVISSKSSLDYLYSSIDYIPATALRGAFAYVYPEQNRGDTTFNKLFLNSDKVCWGNLYPSIGQISKVIPRTAKTCKITQGFTADGGHGVFDALLYLILQAESNNYDILPEDCRCGSVYDRVPFKFYAENNDYKEAPVKKRVVTKVALDRLTESAKEGMLYSYEMINEGQTFSGEILLSDEILEDFQRLVSSTDVIWVGRGRTRGFGKLEIQFAPPENFVLNTENKFNLFQAKLREMAEERNIKLNEFYFSLLLKSDCIIQGDNGNEFFKSVTEEYLQNNFQINATFIAGESSTRIISGWNYKQKEAKQDVLAIEKGSVFAFKTDMDREQLLQKLTDIEKKGIGIRKEEGFGRVSVCDDFHREVQNA